MKFTRRVISSLLAVLLVFTMPVAPAYGWHDGVPPEGHIETAAGYQDGDVLPAATTTISTLMGTFQKGGTDQTNANSVMDDRGIFMAWDRNRDGEINHLDEPVANTTLSAQLTAGVTTASVVSTTGWAESGWFVCEDELIKYTGITGTTITNLVRGVYETDDATHATALGVVQTNAWDRVAYGDVDGSPIDTVGWDSSETGADDGTEGDVLQGETITVVAGRSYLLKLRIKDTSGNTNNEDGGSVDRWYSYGPDSYTDVDGDAGQGLEDDEVLWIRINKHRRRYP